MLSVRSVLLSTAGTLLLWMGAAGVSRASAAHNFSIPAAPLSDELNSLAQQSGLQVLFSSQLVARFRGPEIKGVLTAEEALSKLLVHTGLRFEFVNSHTVTILGVPPAALGVPPVAPRATGPTSGVDAASEEAATGTKKSAAGSTNNQQGEKPVPHRNFLARLLGIFVISGAAAAQSSPDGAALEEIVVTATKRPENLQSVPLTVSVVSQAMLQSQNLADTSDLKRLIPDVQYTHGLSATEDHFGMRGITTQVVGQGLEQSVGVAFDGVSLARTVGSIADLVDIHSVEALKGPQGMLFGKNASAGLINIISNTPELGKTEGIARVSYGSLNLRQYSGTVNLPVTDESALRVSAWKFRHDGPVHEANTGQDMNDKNSDGARVRYRWKPTDNLDLNFTGEWTHHDENGTGTTIRAFIPANYTAGNLGGVIQAWELAHGTVPSDHNLTARGLDLPYYDKGTSSAYTGQGDYLLGDGTVTAIVSYRDIYSDSQYDTYPSDNPTNLRTKNENTVVYDQLSQELRYTSPAAQRLRYVAGLFNFRLNLREDQQVALRLYKTPMYIADNFDKREKNSNYAAFGEVTFDITSTLHVIGGLRRSTEKLDGSMARTFLNPPPPILQGFNSPGAAYGLFSTGSSTTYDDLSWRTGLQYQVAPDAMLYATASRGYKGPGYGYSLTSTASALAAANNGVVKAEIAHGYEVGFKSQWFERRVLLNVALYNEIFDNFQTSLVIQGPIVIFAIENAKQAKTTGVDLDANWLVTPDFSLAASLTYDHARYTDFANAPCYTNQKAGCVNSTQNLDGQALANTPKSSSNVTARYEHPISDALRGYLQVNHSYRSRINFSTTGDPNTIQGGYGLLNVTAGVNTADGRWGASVYGNNVLNKYYVDGINYIATGAVQTNDIGYEDLRNYGIALSARF